MIRFQKVVELAPLLAFYSIDLCEHILYEFEQVNSGDIQLPLRITRSALSFVLLIIVLCRMANVSFIYHYWEPALHTSHLSSVFLASVEVICSQINTDSETTQMKIIAFEAIRELVYFACFSHSISNKHMMFFRVQTVMRDLFVFCDLFLVLAASIDQGKSLLVSSLLFASAYIIVNSFSSKTFQKQTSSQKQLTINAVTCRSTLELAGERTPGIILNYSQELPQPKRSTLDNSSKHHPLKVQEIALDGSILTPAMRSFVDPESRPTLNINEDDDIDGGKSPQAKDDFEMSIATFRQKSRQSNKSSKYTKKGKRDPITSIHQKLDALQKQFLEISQRSPETETLPTFNCLPPPPHLNHLHSMRSFDDSPIYKIMENISLGLLCYDIEIDEVTFSNKYIRDIFHLSDSKDVFDKMMSLRNYMIKDPPSTIIQAGQQASRNLDMLPHDIFTKDFRSFQTISQMSINQINTSSDQFQGSLMNNTKHSIGIPGVATAMSISMQGISELEPSVQGKTSFTNSLHQKDREKDFSNQQPPKTIYSTASTLRIQVTELINLIKDDHIPPNEEFQKIRFMSQQFGPPSGRNVNDHSRKTIFAPTKDRILQITLTPFFHGGRFLILIIVEDVTHFNQIKVLESLNQNKSSMLSQVSHEIRNPVSCIIAMLEDIQQNIDEDKTMVLECTQTALQSSRLLLNLLNDLLDMSQVKAGKFKLVLETFSIVDLLEEVKKMMQPLAKNKQNTILVQSELDPKNVTTVSDKYRIRQILINLLSNSIKYTQKGNIYLSVEPEKEDERYLRIAVRDEGIGIKKEFRQNLFKAFGVAEDHDSKSKNNPHGVGLGLMISNTIARNLKPQIGSSNQQNSMIMSSKLSNNLGKSQQTRFGQKNPSTSQQPRRTVVQFQPQPPFLPDEGLVLNENIEIGSEFYFTIFNYSTQPSSQQPIQRTQSIAGGSQIDNLITGQKQRAQSIIVRRHLFFPTDEIVTLTQQSTTLSGFIGSPKEATVLSKHSKYVRDKVDEEEEENFCSDEPIPTGNTSEEDSSYRQNESQNQLKNSSVKQGLSLSGKRSESMYKQGVDHNFQATISSAIKRRSQYLGIEATKKQIEILIVDDDQFSAMALRSKITAAFKQFNSSIALSFTTLFSGTECVEMLLKREKVFSFLFIDSQMPELDGFETVKQIDAYNLRINPTEAIGNSPNNLRQLEVVLCSGMQPEDPKMLLYRIDHFLLKPVEISFLLEILSEVFEEQEINNQLF